MKSLIISLVICVAAFQITNSIFQSCSGKSFLCKNSTHFQICIDIGQDNITLTLDDIVEACPAGTVCNMTNSIECKGPDLTTLRPNVTVKANVTTVKPKVTTVKPKVTTVKPKVTTVKPKVTTVVSATKCPRKGNFANPSDCHSYYKCQGSQIIKVNCPWNTVFSAVAGMCTHQKESCGSTVDEIPCYLNGRFRDPKNCQSYINCQREGGKWKKTMVYCSSHFSFHEMTGKCIYSNRGCH